MLPTLTTKPFTNPDWLFEPKLDGIRAITRVDDGSVKLLSRRGLDATQRYPALAARLRATKNPVVLDGEIVALDPGGRPSFHLLQQRMNLSDSREIAWAEAHIPLVYYVFDILHYDGWEFLATPLERRREVLREVVEADDQVRILDAFPEMGEIAYEAAVSHGFEGLVAKRRGSRYEPGARSRSWLKVKATTTDDFVIGGYTPGMGARSDTFGSLLLGTYAEAGKLLYAGNVGTGFDQRLLREIRQLLDRDRVERSPFSEPVTLKGGLKGVTWIRPTRVAEVKYAEWTPDGRLRAPVFVTLRSDKAPAEARRPAVAPAPAAAPAAQELLPLEAEPARVIAALEQTTGKEVVVEVEDHRLKLTNLDRVFWPAHGDTRALTKRDLFIYYARIAPYLLPHLKDRPLTLIRYPDGIHGVRFFQKHVKPEVYVQTVRLHSTHVGGMQEYLLCNNFATLLWIGQMGGLEMHSSYARVSPEPDALHVTAASDTGLADTLFDYPDFLIFDFDPYLYSGEEKPGDEPELHREGFERTRDAALWLNEVLGPLGLTGFVKTSGRTGLHIFVPIKRTLTYDATRSAVSVVASYLMREHPEKLTMEWSVPKRTGKIFLDVNQNVRAKTVASLLSPRAAPEATVSMPVDWSELAALYPTDFTLLTAPERLAAGGDPWARILAAKQDLGAVLGLS
jgi:bifunctional non-homologous end joining protein LigD